MTALGTGLRQGKLLGLRWEDVDLDARLLRVRHSLANVAGTLTLLGPKTERSRRHVMLPESVIAALRAHRTRQRMERQVAGSRWVDSGHVFTTSVGTPIHAATMTRALQAALARAGLPRSRFHDLRHAAATFLLAQGMTLGDVKQLLGHSSITLTSNTDGHVLEQRQRQVAQAMDACWKGRVADPSLLLTTARNLWPVSSFPSWLDALLPTQTPTLRPLLATSPERVWHIDVEFVPWHVSAGAMLTGSDTWNGKALIASSSPSLHASVGEVEIAQRLRASFPTRFTYWTAGSGHPPRQWRDWALTPAVRAQEPWLVELDRRIRGADDALRDNQRGWPDVVSWYSGAEDLICVEYKGPFPSNPDVLDTVSSEQHAWLRGAIRQGLLDPDRYAVATWVPSQAAKIVLREQSSARLRRPAAADAFPEARLVLPRAASSNAVSEASRGPQGKEPGPGGIRHREGKLHRRTIRTILKQTTGAVVVSHVDGTIDVEIPSSWAASAFRDLVVDEVARLGYSPTAIVKERRPGRRIVRVSTPETLDQQGQGAHGES